MAGPRTRNLMRSISNAANEQKLVAHWRPGPQFVTASGQTCRDAPSPTAVSLAPTQLDLCIARSSCRGARARALAPST